MKELIRQMIDSCECSVLLADFIFAVVYSAKYAHYLLDVGDKVGESSR